MQHNVPKVAQTDLRAGRWPADPELEWCPPGHGDIYPALGHQRHAGAVLLDAGYRYAFVVECR